MSDAIEVKVSTLKIIYDSLLPIDQKLNSILEDVVKKTIQMAPSERALLLEFCSHASTLKVILEDYFDRNFNSEKLKLSKQEYMLLVSIAKSVEMSSRAQLGNVSFWEH